jgi:hypothetical protein
VDRTPRRVDDGDRERAGAGARERTHPGAVVARTDIEIDRHPIIIAGAAADRILRR